MCVSNGNKLQLKMNGFHSTKNLPLQSSTNTEFAVKLLRLTKLNNATFIAFFDSLRSFNSTVFYAYTIACKLSCTIYRKCLFVVFQWLQFWHIHWLVQVHVQRDKSFIPFKQTQLSNTLLPGRVWACSDSSRLLNYPKNLKSLKCELTSLGLLELWAFITYKCVILVKFKPFILDCCFYLSVE